MRAGDGQTRAGKTFQAEGSVRQDVEVGTQKADPGLKRLKLACRHLGVRRVFLTGPSGSLGPKSKLLAGILVAWKHGKK